LAERDGRKLYMSGELSTIGDPATIGEPSSASATTAVGGATSQVLARSKATFIAIDRSELLARAAD